MGCCEPFHCSMQAFTEWCQFQLSLNAQHWKDSTRKETVNLDVGYSSHPLGNRAIVHLHINMLGAQWPAPNMN